MSATINDHIRRRAGKLPATAAPTGAQGAQVTLVQRDDETKEAG